MNLINKKTTTLLLAGFAAFSMSGCGTEGTPSETGIIPGVEDPTTAPPVVVPPKDMTTVQAKDAMALNAIVYPIGVGVSSFTTCLINAAGGGLGGVLECFPDIIPSSQTPTSQSSQATVSLLSASTQESDIGPYPCTEGDSEGVNGWFTASFVADTLKLVFGTGPTGTETGQICEDIGNTQDIHDQMVSICFDIATGNLPNSVSAAGTTAEPYKVIYKGHVECAPTKFSGDYSYATRNNGEPNYEGTLEYNGTLEMVPGTGLEIKVDGYIHEVRDYSNWNPDPDVGSDERWSFEMLTLKAMPGAEADENSLSVDGKFGYTGKLTEMKELSMTFNNYVLDMKHVAPKDVDLTVTGGLDASCSLLGVVNYATTSTVLADIDAMRDPDGKRMPSDGTMSMTVDGYNPVPAVFGPTAAEVTITSGDGPVTYESWKEITTGSSCQVLQDFIDGAFGTTAP